jgi:glycosyltransferase involved in cell wall biosynthesis
MARVELACLLPARNAAHDLPGWFESVERCADAVIALDDGSTDGTRAMLAAHPLVRQLLTNPVRPSYEGWDDHANRARLLSAAAELSPAWILWLDADERLPPDEAMALRQFLARGADRQHAYLVTVYPLVGDLEHFDAGQPLVVGRLFPFEIGQELPTGRLHFVPLPTSIPSARWVRTTLRIQHLVGLTPAHQRARYMKYQEADPGRRFEKRYGHLVRAPRDVRRWRPRPPGLPVVRNGAGLGDDGDSTRLPLSVIVISRNDETRIERTVGSIVAQQVPAEFEVIVVTSGTDRTAEIVRTRFPSVHLIELPRPALPGEARNAGLAVARGRFVTFPGSHVELAAGSLAARLAAHQLGYAMVTGTITNGTPTRSGWAAYFLENTPVLPGRPSGPLDVAPATCSYLRAALEHVGGFREGWRAGEDTLVNLALFDLGYGAWHAHAARYIHYTPCATLGRLLRHHFTRGRAFARVVLAQRQASQPGHTRRMLRLLVFYVPYRLVHIEKRVRRWGGPELRRRWRSTRPLAAVAVIAAWVGLCDELLRSALHPRRAGAGARGKSGVSHACPGAGD